MEEVECKNPCDYPVSEMCFDCKIAQAKLWAKPY